jgi:lysophospholipase L1-like esterase
MGSLFFYGFRCEGLIDFSEPDRKIECYGNSITCGAKMITGELCEQTSNWNAPNKAYASYGAVTARALNARWVLTSVSGIGLIHSCCEMPNTMPGTYNRLFLEKPESEKWDFGLYIPDAVTICLGQNDGATVVASDEFKTKYIEFVKVLKSKYPKTSFFLLTSPMADLNLFNAMNSCIDNVIQQLSADGITKIYKTELPYNLTHGCQSHPNEKEHAEIAEVLENSIKEKMGW